MNNLAQRSLTGALLVLIILVSVTAGAYSFIFLTLAINLLSLLEFYRLFYNEGLQPRSVPGIVLSATMLITCALALTGVTGPKVLLINIPLAFFIFVLELYARAKNPFHNLAITFLGVFCITVPLFFFICIAFLPSIAGAYHWHIILAYFFLLWASDTGAYFVGKTFGRRQLFKRVSPNKTWEGSIGGAACALLVAYLISHYFTMLNTTNWLGIASIIIVAGTFGDLIKSLLKRSLNLKDAGSILPGHGGMLDRFDTLLGSAPFVFCWLMLYPHV